MNEQAKPHKEGADTPAGDVPFETSEVVNRIKTENPTAETKLEEVERKMNAFERSTLRWTRANFLVVGATGLFICLQWCEMRSGGADTHDLAEATKKEAAANVQQVSSFAAVAMAAKNQADVAHGELDLLRMAQSPWLGVIGGVIRVKGGQVITAREAKLGVVLWDVHLDLQNFGQRPATNAFAEMQAWIPPTAGSVISAATPPNSLFEVICSRADFLIAPKETTIVQNVIISRPSPFSLMPTEHRDTSEAAVSGSVDPYSADTVPIVWLVGCITYREELGTQRHTIFLAHNRINPNVSRYKVSADREIVSPNFDAFDVTLENSWFGSGKKSPGHSPN